MPSIEGSSTIILNHCLKKGDRRLEVDVGMSVQAKVSTQLLLQIAEQLDDEEIEEIQFLCRDFANSTDIRELLGYVNELALIELLYTVKRFDLLKRYLKLVRTEAETILKTHPRKLPEYRVLMIEINEQLEESDLGSLLFLLKDKMKSGGKLKNKTFLSLVTELEKMNFLSPEKVELLEESLKTIHRIDLKNKLCKYRQAASTRPYINAVGASPSVQGSIAKTPPSKRHMNGTHSKGATLPVQESGAFYQSEVRDRYILKNNPVGLCVIIDCIGNDADMLEQTFRFLHFSIRRYMYITMRDLESILQEVSQMDELKNYDMFVCFLVSRGSSNSIFCIDQSFPGYPLDTVKNFFTGRSCPALVGKPKLFFIQNYIVSETEEPGSNDQLEVDGPAIARDATKERIPTQKIPNEADIFWSHCKVDEMELQRTTSSTSSYLNYLSQLLSNKQKRKQHLLDIHTELNGCIYSKKQGHSLQLRHTLTKKLFLPLN
ncbi:CASP8 and FADD-like apoptosis regulator isoform 2-T4 [Discoglossus pictus]